ncbi:MAG: threonine/serine dehydratase [Streptosporangiaceae bacterium]
MGTPQEAPASHLTAASVADVARVIGPYVRRTPVLTIDRAELGLPPGPLTLKLEQFQHSGSFKVRGAFANLLLRNVPTAGVAAASGGNHGAAVAYAASVLGIAARIFVPDVSSPAKIARIRAYGADLVVQGETYSDALAVSEDWVAASGAMPVHAYDQAETILGAGTAGLELLQQAPSASTVLASVGGGGLLSGIATAADATSDAARASVRVIGAEPEGAPTMSAALAAGGPVDAPTGSVAVDSLAPRRVGDLTFAVVANRAHSIVLVSDDAILTAQRLLWERLRIVAEPGGCAAVAALICGAYSPEPGEHVAAVVSGANTTAVDFGR